MNYGDFFTTVIFAFFVLASTDYIISQYPGFLTSISQYTSDKIESSKLKKLINNRNGKYHFILQFTTRGGEMDIIKDGLISLDNSLQSLGSKISELMRIMVLTEDNDDKKIISSLGLTKDVDIYVVPKGYSTQRKTLRKARALHYFSEIKKGIAENSPISLENIFTIFFDAESQLDEQGLKAILYKIYSSKNPQKIYQGPIFYPINWKRSNALSKQMESARPWACFTCYSQTKRGRPYHLHGSNVVVRLDSEAFIGWDFGTLYNYPLVAEDLLFGIKSYLTFGKKAFGWHGGAMHEQPAFHVKDSVSQRVRWVLGSLQAIQLIKNWPEFKNKSFKFRKSMTMKMNLKIVLYAFGFIASLFTIGILIFILFYYLIYETFFLGLGLFMSEINIFESYAMTTIPKWIRIVTLGGSFLWLTSFQVGLYFNLKHSNLSKINKIFEHIKILLISPLGSIFDTGSAFITVLKWKLGNKQATWRITTKYSQSPLPINRLETMEVLKSETRA